MTIFSYDLGGVGQNLQLGNGGGELKWDTDHFEFTTDGTILAPIRVSTTPVNTNDAASKAYVDSLTVNIQDDGVGVVNNVTTLNFAGPMFDVTSSGTGLATVTGVRVPMSVIIEPNAARTAQLTDDCNYVVMTSNVPCTFTVPNTGTANFPIGAVITIEQAGSGQITVVEDTGVTVNSAALMTSRDQYSVIMIVKRDSNVWTLTGDLTL